LAGYLYEINNKENFSNIVIPTEKDFLKFLSNPLIPQKISDKPVKLLKYLNNHTEEYGQKIIVLNACMYAKNFHESFEIIAMLNKDLLIQGDTSNGIFNIAITYKGMQYIEKYERENAVKPDQAFVAMWFSKTDPIPDDVWENIIKPGCLDAGYKAERVSDRDYNDSVVDEIIALIKESAFSVVDYSGYRGGVYFEAGYAKGLGKEVISLCHDSWFNGNEKENKKVHFDVNHNNFIVWETGKETVARNQLTNRIRATVGKGNYKTE
jgi:hypothetical protein